MIVGVPREAHRHEHRVGLAPSAVARLARSGHEVLVERNAGAGAHFPDETYEEAGGRIVYNRDEIYGRSGLVCRVGSVSLEELELLHPGTVVCGFHSLAVAPRAKLERMMELETTVVGYEIIRDATGHLPVLFPMSEMAGQMAVQIAAHYLQTEVGGRGILLGNVPGVPPPTVLILGGGGVGGTAAKKAVDGGAHVIVVDTDLGRLRQLDKDLNGRVVTVVPSGDRLARYVEFADVVIGAVLVPGSRTPDIVTEDMVRSMKPGSVVIDVSIDQGGCVETARPTNLESPTFTAHGVIHYCVPNITANIARTASRAMANAAIPYVAEMADRGVEAALAAHRGLASGMYLYRGRLVNLEVSQALDLPYSPWSEVLGPDSDA